MEYFEFFTCVVSDCETCTKNPSRSSLKAYPYRDYYIIFPEDIWWKNAAKYGKVLTISLSKYAGLRNLLHWCLFFCK